MKKVVRAEKGAAVVSAAEVIEITGSWKAAELMKVFNTIETLREAKQ